MSHMPSQSGSSLDATERRQHPRHQVKSLAYLDIGPDNGGIVLNVSEGGLAIHAVGVLPSEPEIGLRIQLPKSTKRLEARGKIAWTSGSKKDAGIEFIDLPEQARLEIEDWVSAEIAPEPVRTEDETQPQPEPTQSPRKRTDKWTGLVAELTSQAETAKQEIATPSGFLPLRSSRTPLPQQADYPSSPPLAGSDPIVASGLRAAEKREAEFNSAETPANEPTEPSVEIFQDFESKMSPADAPSETSEHVGETHRPRNPELSLPSDTLLNSPSQPFTVVSGGGEKTGTANGFRTFQGSVVGALPVDDFLAKARALFSVKRVQRSKPGATGQSSILESKTEAAPEQELAGDVAQVQPVPASQSELQASSSSVLGELPFAQAPVDAEPILRTKLTDSRAANSRSQHGSQESAREFDLRGTLGILALCVILAVVCLGVGIAVGRKSSKPAPNASGSNSTAAAQSSASPMIDAQSLSTENSASLQRSGASRHTDNRGQGPAAGRRLHSTPANSQDFGGDPQASPSEPGDDNPTAGKSASESEPAAAAPSQISPAAGNSGAALNPSSSSNVSPTVSPDSRVNASREGEVTTPARPSSERLVPAHVIYRVEPFYPRTALEQRVEGTVRIHATVGQDGRVRNLRVVSGPALLTSAALDAAQYWRYIPSLRNGEPIETEEEISIEFHFQH